MVFVFIYFIFVSFCVCVCGYPQKDKMSRLNSNRLPQGFYRTELVSTAWEVPVKYQRLAPLGSGAYGQVW